MSSQNLLYDLEFSYAFDLAHFERPRGQRECTEVSETQKHDIVQIPAGFAWFVYPKKNIAIWHAERDSAIVRISVFLKVLVICPKKTKVAQKPQKWPPL